MTEQAQAAAEVAAPQSIPMSEGVARYAAAKAAAQSPETNPVTEAARTLGKQAAAARATARQAQAQQTEEASQEEVQQDDVEDDPQAQTGETLDETANAESPDETETEAEDEPAPQTIDLGDGVKVTLDEVRDGFMMKADHTRKTQALADERKSFEAERAQRLTRLDTTLESLKSQLPQPKDLESFVDELGADEGLKAFSRQNKRLQELVGAYQNVENEKAKAQLEAQTARDKDLAENYNKEWADDTKRVKAYTALSAYALSQGAQAEELKGVTAWMLKAMDKAQKYDALQANKGTVTKLIADKPRITKPGSKVSAQASVQTNIQAATAKLKSSGNIADAVALLRTMRGGKSRLS